MRVEFMRAKCNSYEYSTYKEISLCDSRTTFPRNFITTRYIYYVNNIVSQFPAEIGSQVICRKTLSEYPKLFLHET